MGIMNKLKSLTTSKVSSQQGSVSRQSPSAAVAAPVAAPPVAPPPVVAVAAPPAENPILRKVRDDLDGYLAGVGRGAKLVQMSQVKDDIIRLVEESLKTDSRSSKPEEGGSLIITGSQIETLPACIDDIPNLKKLTIRRCLKLGAIPDFEKLALSLLTIVDCPQIASIPVFNAKDVLIRQCPNLASVGDLLNLEVVRLIDCPFTLEMGDMNGRPVIRETSIQA